MGHPALLHCLAKELQALANDDDVSSGRNVDLDWMLAAQDKVKAQRRPDATARGACLEFKVLGPSAQNGTS